MDTLISIATAWIAAQFYDQAQRDVFEGDPDARTIGVHAMSEPADQEIEKLDREDALAFYKRFYAPNNAILVIAGDVDAAEIRPMAERTFGMVAAQPGIPVRRVRPQEPEPAAPRTVTLSDARVEQPSLPALSISFRPPPPPHREKARPSTCWRN